MLSTPAVGSQSPSQCPPSVHPVSIPVSTQCSSGGGGLQGVPTAGRKQKFGLVLDFPSVLALPWELAPDRVCSSRQRKEEGEAALFSEINEVISSLRVRVPGSCIFHASLEVFVII